MTQGIDAGRTCDPFRPSPPSTRGRLADGSVVTILWERGQRARVHFDPGADLHDTGPLRVPRPPGGTGHDRTIRRSDIVDRWILISPD